MGDTHWIVIAHEDEIVTNERINARHRHTFLIPGEKDSVWVVEITPIRKRRSRGG